jgi:glycosyltransferase involved in cell wall biosynthesis
VRPLVNLGAAPTVAVAMSCYNGRAFVEAQVVSILAQTMPINHLSVWDDGSTDDTWTRLQHLAARHPAMHVHKGERNLGVNRGFEAALQLCPPSDWYAFSDQDDLWPADRIERFVVHASARDPTVPLLLVCQFAVFQAALPQPGQQTSLTLLRHGDVRTPWVRSLLAANPFYGCCFFFNHALRERVGTIPQGKTTHDYWVALLAAYFGRIEILDFVGTYYRQHGANASFGAPRRGLWAKLGNVQRSLQADRRSRADMVPLIQGLLQHPHNAEIEPQDRSVLEQALTAYLRGGWALVDFQRRQGAWARRPTHNALRVVSCLSDRLVARD